MYAINEILVMNSIKKIFLIFLLFQFNIKLLSQDLKKIDGFAITLKTGPSISFNDPNEVNLPIDVMGLEVNILNNNFIYSVDYLGHDKTGILLGFNLPSQNQLGIMMGKYKGEKKIRIQYQAGINMFWGQFYNPDGTQPVLMSLGGPSKSFSTVGAVSKVGFKYFPLENLSIGIDFQINLNSVKSLYMPMFSIEIGKLRNAI